MNFNSTFITVFIQLVSQEENVEESNPLTLVDKLITESNTGNCNGVSELIDISLSTIMSILKIL